MSELSHHFIDLPLTKLHYVKCGTGPPLIMVPATISQIDYWDSLIRFMGQRFTAHFFDLPGHCKSTPFSKNFTSELVAETVEDLIDALGFEKITLMGFSFGGILTLKTLARIEHRVDRVALVAPCVSRHALLLSSLRQWGIRRFNTLLKKPSFQRGIISLLHSPLTENSMISFVRKFGRVEDNVPLDDNLHKLPPSTLDVLAYQFDEVFSLDFPELKERYSLPLHFAMSINDPLLDFSTTFNFLNSYFSDISSNILTFPYHQPPSRPTTDFLEREFGTFLDGLPT